VHRSSKKEPVGKYQTDDNAEKLAELIEQKPGKNNTNRKKEQCKPTDPFHPENSNKPFS
jgi:hypothetical protein